MTSRRSPLALVRTAAGPAIALFVIVYFAGSAIVGPNGLMSLAGYRSQRAQHLKTLAALQAERQVLEHRAALLDPGHVDPDLADQITRAETGQIHAYLEIKWPEVARWEMTPAPVEFDMYYSA